jgi:hypothetical protein
VVFDVMHDLAEQPAQGGVGMALATLLRGKVGPALAQRDLDEIKQGGQAG